MTPTLQTSSVLFMSALVLVTNAVVNASEYITPAVATEAAQYSNHAIGEKNLCLSVLTEQLDRKVFYVPNQSRNKIVGFTFRNNEFELFEEITQIVDFSEPLDAQYNFINTIEEENNCINAK